MYIEDYLKPSRWYAFAIDMGNEDWRKMDKLSDRVDELASAAFESGHNNTDDRSVLRYGPPPGYTGVKNIGSRKVS